mgnify:CR=1 FL=1
MSKHYVVSESYPAYRYHIRSCSQDEKGRKDNHRPNTVFALCGGEVRWDTLCPVPSKPEHWKTRDAITLRFWTRRLLKSRSRLRSVPRKTSKTQSGSFGVSLCGT